MGCDGHHKKAFYFFAPSMKVRPKLIAEMNDYQFKIVKLEGDFIWYDHKNKAPVLHQKVTNSFPTVNGQRGRSACGTARQIRSGHQLENG